MSNNPSHGQKPIRVQCPGCQAEFRAPITMRGKQCRCPKCQTIIRVATKSEESANAPEPVVPTNPNLGDLFDELPAGDIASSQPQISLPKYEPVAEPTQEYHPPKPPRNMTILGAIFSENGSWWFHYHLLRKGPGGLLLLHFFDLTMVLISLVFLPIFGLIVFQLGDRHIILGLAPIVIGGVSIWLTSGMIYSATFYPDLNASESLFMIFFYRGPRTYYFWALLYPLVIAVMSLAFYFLFTGLGGHH